VGPGARQHRPAARGAAREGHDPLHARPIRTSHKLDDDDDEEEEDDDDDTRLPSQVMIQWSLAHGNIIRLHEMLLERDTLYLLMELAQGGELLPWLVSQVGWGGCTPLLCLLTTTFHL
jgi:serine/threonine protein kinase